MANPKEIDQDDLKLREMGFDPAAPASEALARAGELRGKPGASDAALARALGDINDPGAARMLAAMEAGASGALRREIRRSLFKLRQRGIAVPESEPPRAPAAQAAPAETGLSALISPIDPEGAQIVWMTKSRMQGGLHRLWALVSETEGLVGAQVVELTRKELRAQRHDLEQQSGMKLVDADPRLADFIVSDAYRRTPQARRGQVGNFYALRAELTASAPPTEFTHPIYAELAADVQAEPSPELMKEPEILAIRFSPEDLKPYLEEVNRAQESVLVVSRASQEQRILGAVEHALDALLSGERAHRMRRRLEDTAYYMMKDGRRQAAGWAAAAAARIRDGAELKRIAFFRALMQAHLGSQMAQEAERKQSEPRLIMTPAEAMRAREQQARMRGPRR